MNNQMKQYIDILSEYSDFTIEQEGASVIKCQNSSDPILIKLAGDFLIKSHFTGKTCFEKAVSLMNYVHNELFSTGNNITPAENNTYSIMGVRKKGVLFCSYYSTVFSEMLLSMGVPCVKVTCMPKEFDHDRHFAVMAYIDDKKKWVFLDPTYNTYFANENFLPMDLYEIRRAYLAKQPHNLKHIETEKKGKLFMNGVEYKTYDKWYSAYMAKNIFRFMCPQESRFNSSSSPQLKFFAINPIGYITKNEYDTMTEEANIKYTDNIRFAFD